MKPKGSTTLEGKVTIACGRRGADDLPTVRIEITDDLSFVQFLDLKMTAEEFVSAIGGLGHVPCEFTLRGLDKVGKVHEHDTLELELGPAGDYSFDRKKRAQMLANQWCEKNEGGWYPDLQFNSQTSFFAKNGRQFARTTIRRYVDLKV